jgi:hypothetical protein
MGMKFSIAVKSNTQMFVTGNKFYFLDPEFFFQPWLAAILKIAAILKKNRWLTDFIKQIP